MCEECVGRFRERRAYHARRQWRIGAHWGAGNIGEFFARWVKVEGTTAIVIRAVGAIDLDARRITSGGRAVRPVADPI